MRIEHGQNIVSGISVISQNFLQKGKYEDRRSLSDFSVSLNHLKSNKWQFANKNFKKVREFIYYSPSTELSLLVQVLSKHEM